MSDTRRSPHIDPASETGQTLAEYAIVVSLIAVTVIGTVSLLGAPIAGFYGAFAGAFGG